MAVEISSQSIVEKAIKESPFKNVTEFSKPTDFQYKLRPFSLDSKLSGLAELEVPGVHVHPLFLERK